MKLHFYSWLMQVFCDKEQNTSRVNPYEQLISTINLTSFALSKDQLDYLLCNIDYGESSLALEHFLSMLHDHSVPISNSTLQTLTELCEEIGAPYLERMIPLITSQVCEEDEIEIIWNSRKQSEGKVEQPSTFGLEFPEFAKYERMKREGVDIFQIVNEVKKDEVLLIRGITVLRRLYGMPLKEALQLWRDVN
jgi:hypothetical protein